MSTDTLAALLDEMAQGIANSGHGWTDSGAAAQWLRERGVVVLPADHPLRTGQPSPRMVSAVRLKALDHAPIDDKNAKELVRYYEDLVRAALAVLRES